MREGLSQNVSGEGSLFNVSPPSPGLVVRSIRQGGAAPSEGILLPTMLGDFDDSVLGDPITYVQIEQLPGSESPLSLHMYAWPSNSALLMDSVIQTVLAPRKSEWLAAGTSVADPHVTPGNDRVLKSGLPGCPYCFLESGELPFTDGNLAYGLITATSSSFSGVSDYWTVHHRSGWKNTLVPSSAIRRATFAIFRRAAELGRGPAKVEE